MLAHSGGPADQSSATMYACLCVGVGVCMYVCMYVCVYVCICGCMYYVCMP